MSYRILVLVLAIFAALGLAACQPPQGTSSDAQAAQSLLPNIVGYTRSDSNSIVSAITAAGAGAALTTGNAPLAAGIARAEAVVQCLQGTGSLALNTYLQDRFTLIPEAGVVLVVNQTRVNENLLACLVQPGNMAGARAQSATIEPCTASGSFRFRDNDYSYLYVGVGTQLCGYFQTHFASLSGTN